MVTGRGARLSVHAVPTLGGQRFFRTMTGAKMFARALAREAGAKGYSIHTLDSDYVIELLNQHIPHDGLEDIGG